MAESYTMEGRINSYELSLWTQTDQFLRLLKGKISFEGEAYNTIFTKKIDGGNELSFSIPLYIFDYDQGRLIENPLWPLIFGEQKIRLIRNRGESVESIYDFIIKTFSEGRENDITIMNVVCKSYTLYALNKIGLEIIASEDSNIGICKSVTPPEFADKNAIWIDYDNNFHIYAGDSEDDSTDESLWVAITDIYENGLPELLVNSIVRPQILQSTPSSLSPTINTVKYKTITATIISSNAIMCYVQSVEGMINDAKITATISNSVCSLLSPTIITV